MSARLLGLLLLIGACRSAPRPEGAIVLRVDGPARLAYVDDSPVTLYPGRATRITVPGGLHRLEIRAPGHFTAYREVRVAPGGRSELQVALRPDPDAETEPAPALDRARSRLHEPP